MSNSAAQPRSKRASSVSSGSNTRSQSYFSSTNWRPRRPRARALDDDPPRDDGLICSESLDRKVGFDIEVAEHAVSKIVCETQQNCCVCRFSWGTTSGLKSVKISAGSVEFVGVLDLSKRGTDALMACCGE